jgi:O-antigen/teichoic acid export membrane protein
VVTTTDQLPVEAGVPDPLESLGLRRILRSASGLSGASLIGSVLAVGAGFLAAHWLGPARYGDGQFVLLIYLYATLMRSGVFEGSIRAVIDHLARGEADEARHAQNVGVSFELIVSALPGVALTIVGFFVAPGVVQLGLFLAPIAVIASCGSSFLSTLWSARSRFDVVGKVAVAQAILGPVLLVVLVATIGTAGVFLAPAIASLVTAALYFAFRPPLQLHPSFDTRAARPFLRVGFPLGLLAEIYWAYRLVGSTSIAIASSSFALGLYTFAAAPIAVATSAIGGIQAVLLPTVWRELSRGASGPVWARHAERITIAMGLIAAAVAGLGQAGFAPMVMAFTPSFAGSIRLFDILALTILLLPIATVPSLVLDSKRVNRQKRHLSIWIAALLVNIVANVIVLRAGWGAQAIAVNDVWVQFLVVVVIFETAAPHIWEGGGGRRFALYPKMALVLVVAVAVTMVLDLGVSGLHPGHLDVAALLIRCGATALVWAAVAVILLRPQRNVTTSTD